MHAADILIDEHTLVLRLIEGDENAFCELYAAYKNRLIYFAIGYSSMRRSSSLQLALLYLSPG